MLNLFVRLPVRNRAEFQDNTNEFTFGPKFTHAICLTPNVFGYTELKVMLYYSAATMEVFPVVDYAKTSNDFQSADWKADDIAGSVSKFLKPGFTDINQFLTKLDTEDSFKPFGKNPYKWAVEQNGGSRTYEIYEFEWDTPGFAVFFAKLQRLYQFFIERPQFLWSDPTTLCFVW